MLPSSWGTAWGMSALRTPPQCLLSAHIPGTSRGEQQLWSLGHRILLQATARKCTLEILWDTEHADIKPSPRPLVTSIRLTDHICTALLLPIYIALESEKFTSATSSCPGHCRNTQVGENDAGKQEVCCLGPHLQTTGPCAASDIWVAQPRQQGLRRVEARWHRLLSAPECGRYPHEKSPHELWCWAMGYSWKNQNCICCSLNAK